MTPLFFNELENSKMRLTVSVILMIVFLPAFLMAAEMRVATIDLCLAASLHPRMALFDFDRMGFYRVEAGLNSEDFERAVLALKNAPAAFEKAEEAQKLEQNLQEIDRQKSLLMAEPAGRENEITILAREEKTLSDRIADLRYAAACPELTDPATTRSMLDEIEREILATVRMVAASESFDLVLNTSVPVPYGFPVRYQAGEMYGQGVPGINSSLFYSFLAKSNLAHPMDETPPSRELINWLELTHFPEAVNLLPMRPYPLVLSGGESILSRVMRQIYATHRVPPEVFRVVDSVIHKIEDLTDSSDSEGN